MDERSRHGDPRFSALVGGEGDGRNQQNAYAAPDHLADLKTPHLADARRPRLCYTGTVAGGPAAWDRDGKLGNKEGKMSEFPPGTFEFADRMMDMNVASARREAQGRRLAAAARSHSQRFYCALLASLGQHLMAWGVNLYERYSTEGSTPTAAPAD